VDSDWATPGLVTFVATHRQGGLVVALRDRLCHVDLADRVYRELVRIAVPVGGRLNDGTIDARGRVVIGTMCAPDATDASGALFVVDVDGSCSCILDGFRTVNGLAFAPDGRTLYVSDSHPGVRLVWVCDYDVEHGRIDRRRVFIDTRALRGRPDGACVDVDGCYWMAAVDGWSVLRFDAGANIVGELRLPVEKPSKPAFGGAGLGDMFITSLRRNLTVPLQEQPHAGGLFVAYPGTRGMALGDCCVKFR
jgi:sugar lactone lactonase YvrE